MGQGKGEGGKEARELERERVENDGLLTESLLKSHSTIVKTYLVLSFSEPDSRKLSLTLTERHLSFHLVLDQL